MSTHDRLILDVQHLESQLTLVQNECTELLLENREFRGRLGCETPESITIWADETFGPAVSNASIAKRAMKEVRELIETLERDDSSPAAAEECADIYIILCRLVRRLGANYQQEVDKKMAICRSRKWILHGDGHGQHVPGTR
jgi:hypothetical protein